jgi:DNA-binding MarR family transcriptional regulator
MAARQMTPARQATAAAQTTPPPEFDLSNFLCFAIYSANSAFNRAYKPLLDKLGLTYPQYLVMVSLWAQDDQTVGGIGQHLFLDTSTLTPLLKRLEAAGLVSRVRDTRDERQVRIRLTEAGRALRAKGRQVPSGVAGVVSISPQEAKTLTAGLAALRDGLNVREG